MSFPQITEMLFCLLVPAIEQPIYSNVVRWMILFEGTWGSRDAGLLTVLKRMGMPSRVVERG
jgi:hypothetical protein